MGVATEDNRRAAVVNVRIPPTRFMFALRLRSVSFATARIVAFGFSPYDAELQ